MTSWEKEIRRSATEALYHRDYRYANNLGTALDMMHDILMNDPAFDDLYNTDQYMASEWLRRYMTGFHNKKTGKYTFTIPEPKRYNSIQNYLEQAQILTPVMMQDHKGDLEKSVSVAQYYGYDRYATQALLAGALRGTFYAIANENNGSVAHIIQFHMVKNESLFRVRYVKLFEEDNSVTNGFAATGTNYGVFWTEDAQHIHLKYYVFFQKGRRINRFIAMINGQDIEFALTILPDQIRTVHGLLKSISV